MFHVEHAKTQMRTVLIWVFLTFLNFWRGGASSKSTIISTCSSKTCERFGELGHSLFLRPPHAPNSSSSTMVKNMQAPIVPQCEADVKSFL